MQQCGGANDYGENDENDGGNSSSAIVLQVVLKGLQCSDSDSDGFNKQQRLSKCN